MRFAQLQQLSLLVLFLALIGCGAAPQEEARLKLGQMKLEYKDSTFVRVAQDGSLEAVQLFLRAGMKPNVTNQNGETPLLVAARYGREPVAKVLLAAGADPNVKDAKFGGTPLHWAAVNGYPGIVKLLLDKGADLKARDSKNGMTASDVGIAGG